MYVKLAKNFQVVMETSIEVAIKYIIEDILSILHFLK